MIVGERGGKVFLKEGTIIDLAKIPKSLRLRKYLIKEGERDLREEERLKQMSYAEGQIDDIEELAGLEENQQGNLVKRVPRR